MLSYLFFLLLLLNQIDALKVKSTNELFLKEKIKTRNRNKMRHKHKNQFINVELPMNTEWGKRFKRMFQSMQSGGGSPAQGANERSTDWEFWEDLSTQPKYWHGDVCDLKREAETIVLQCEELNELGKTCYQGEIEYIQLAIYGFVQGECPSYFHSWECSKEIQDLINDDTYGKYECRENDHCRFPVDPNEYKMIPWSTWNVNSGNLPHLAPAAKGSENDNDCENHQEQKLGIIATCKCANPIEMEEEPPEPLSGEFSRPPGPQSPGPGS